MLLHQLWDWGLAHANGIRGVKCAVRIHQCCEISKYCFYSNSQSSWWTGGPWACVCSSSSRAYHPSTTRRLSWSSRIFWTEVRMLLEDVISNMISRMDELFCKVILDPFRHSLAWGKRGTVSQLQKRDWHPADHGHDETSWFKGSEFKSLHLSFSSNKWVVFCLLMHKP